MAIHRTWHKALCWAPCYRHQGITCRGFLGKSAENMGFVEEFDIREPLSHPMGMFKAPSSKPVCVLDAAII